MPDFSESITIAAPPADVYAQVSDLSRMGEWSPECTRVTWTSPGPPALGSRFIGHNRAGAIRWFTQGEVVEAVPGERFSFRIRFGPVPIALWTYTFTTPVTEDAASGGASASRAADGGGTTGSDGDCLVTESWTDHRPAALRTAFGWIFGDRAKRNQYGIHKTLANLKTSLELPT
ncbi:SRPBCC family protein [Kribbella sp. NPDC056861]|uniref:SRPBCC family protein n=1 Tax=Kribbella sp. NPDC056861 TaxID=3154857 RepID=UPI003445356A